ncbi:MAG: phosphoenolpyruvate-protein phosphotransferase [Halobacteria archaeon]|nr:phosphoenolpyruvate-protein phosphotransferase [Halobacteria archaeon]
MMHQSIDIIGMPYVPGMARGTVQCGLVGDNTKKIVLIQQADIEHLQSLPAGFIVVEGAPLSHTLIRLMGAGVPTVIITEHQAALLNEGVDVTLNGASGHITNDLTDFVPAEETPSVVLNEPFVTADGIPVQLRASVRSQTAARKARAEGAESIGLVRSEFILPADGSVPDTQFYQQAFGEICEAAAPLGVTIRLLDVAADKIPPWMPELDNVGGALGLQGVRLYGIEPMRSVYQAQLEAIRTLSERFDIRVLIPYLVRHEELQYWTDYIREKLSKPLSIGAMAETPAGALDMVDWFDVVDFVAIGCNDLMQCLFAADRDKPELRDYLDPYAPLLWRFMQQIAISNDKHLDQIQLCGVLAQLPGIISILLGLGYRTFSVEANLIPYLRCTIATTNTSDASQLAQQVCAAKESRQVLELLGLHDGTYQPFLVP